MQKEKEIVIAAASRTPIGSFCGSLSTVAAPDLAALVVKNILHENKLAPESVDLVVMGNVLSAGVGQAPARQVAIKGGLPVSTAAFSINKVCGSGLEAVAAAARHLLTGEAEVVIAGGMENMSAAPHFLPASRRGYKMGNARLVDSMVFDGLWDPYNDFHMGKAAELCAEKYFISRQEADDYAIQSYQRALGSIKNSLFKDEIVPVEVKERKKSVTIKDDEEPLRGKLDKIPDLSTAFSKSGIITAGNASSLNDGAAAVLVTTRKRAEELNLVPLVKIKQYATHGEKPEWFTIAPVGAIEKVLAKAGLKVGDIDLFEVNEAFAVVPMIAAKKLKIPIEKLNIRGGAVSLGHPIGASGARILVTLVHAMLQTGAEKGLAGLCIGGGEGNAMVLEAL